MAIHDVYGILEIHAQIEADNPESALAIAVFNGDYEVVSSRLKDERATDYVSISEYAERMGWKDATYARRLAEKGALPGAMKIGKVWIVPASTPRIDRRVSTGKYVGSVWHKEHRKKKRLEQKALAENANTDTTE